MNTLENTKILCVGVTPCIQRTLQCDRFRPGEVNRIRRVTVSTGGKSVNAARALAALGSTAIVTGFAGGETGRALISLLEQSGLENHFVPAEEPTRVCITIIDETSGGVTEIVEEAPVPTERELNALCDEVSALSARCGLVVVAGALPPGAPDEIHARLARVAAARAKPVIIDTSGRPLLKALAQRPLLAKLNRDELARTCRGRISSDRSLVRRACGLRERGAAWVLVTAGEKPAWLVGREATWKFIPPKVAAINDVGCGDAATAGIACGVSRGRPMPGAVRTGMACGAANAMTLAPGDIDPATVSALIDRVEVRRAPH